jgi:chromosome segregation ATPase
VRLVRLEIQGFRCYREPTTVDFLAGLNVFSGPNEAGKSALMQAIQHALYLPRL